MEPEDKVISLVYCFLFSKWEEAPGAVLLQKGIEKTALASDPEPVLFEKKAR
jgi:hypothetical protein